MENRVKIQLTVFFLLNYFHIPEFKKKYTELTFYPIFKILVPKSLKTEIVFNFFFFKLRVIIRSKNDQKAKIYLFFHQI